MNFDPITFNEARLAKLAAIAGQQPTLVRVFNLSEDFIVPYAATARIFAVAGSASGGITWGAGLVGGAGAGGCGVKTLRVGTGTTLAMTIGAGGPGVSRSSAGQTSGYYGSNTQITASGGGITTWTATLYGGAPGEVSVAGAGNTAWGGAGGGSTGVWDWAATGGSGGWANSSTFAVGGGGAVNVLRLDTPPLGGCAGNGTGTGSGGAGGAGVGGDGGQKDQVTATSQSAGGGAGGPATTGLGSAAAIGPNALGEFTQTSVSSFVGVQSFFLDYFGGGGVLAVAPGPGGGSGGNPAATLKAPGLFAGGGGAYSGSSGVIALPPGNHGPGSGLHCTAGAWTSAAGGGGLAVLCLYKD